ncbi:hypothetical protein ACFPYJ_02720 [Paenibacillus solisilvae]|uniref:Lipoprotein n=1 Tax=Paenibacillus solisilvae TaxID=2486751 RepID=A0ABW0VQ82_9BACL
MKFILRQLAFIVVIMSLLSLFTGCTDGNNNNEFTEIGNGLAKSLNQLRDEPGITLTGFSSNPDKNLFNVGIGIDPNKITTEHLKQAFDSYLKNAASYTHVKDSTKMLEPYNLRIEELGVDKDKFPVIAVKDAGSNEIKWNEIKYADKEKSAKAIYLVPKSGAQLTYAELRKHPEITVVYNFKDLKDRTSEGVAIWIDKGAINLVEQKWLHQDPQRYNPLVVIGYSDALYSFREKISGFGIQGPHIDWSKQKLNGG